MFLFTPWDHRKYLNESHKPLGPRENLPLGITGMQEPRGPPPRDFLENDHRNAPNRRERIPLTQGPPEFVFTPGDHWNGPKKSERTQLAPREFFTYGDQRNESLKPRDPRENSVTFFYPLGTTRPP